MSFTQRVQGRYQIVIAGDLIDMTKHKAWEVRKEKENDLSKAPTGIKELITKLKTSPQLKDGKVKEVTLLKDLPVIKINTVWHTTVGCREGEGYCEFKNGAFFFEDEKIGSTSDAAFQWFKNWSNPFEGKEKNTGS